MNDCQHGHHLWMSIAVKGVEYWVCGLCGVRIKKGFEPKLCDAIGEVK